MWNNKRVSHTEFQITYINTLLSKERVNFPLLKYVACIAASIQKVKDGKAEKKGDLLYDTGISAQRHVAAWMGAGLGGGWIHGYVWLRPFTVHLKWSQNC